MKYFLEIRRFWLFFLPFRDFLKFGLRKIVVGAGILFFPAAFFYLKSKYGFFPFK
jgi:hypothetical protein